MKFICLAFLQRAEANKGILSHPKTKEENFFPNKPKNAEFYNKILFVTLLCSLFKKQQMSITFFHAIEILIKSFLPSQEYPHSLVNTCLWQRFRGNSIKTFS
ncbi:hypothetical protein O9A_00321 [Bartonella koehlerae C-29]|uniref:Uncharacterized protein n=1 Tax=Bartonella koehlerae C-29 TaxID=1134510 RepID=A0A067WB11_9HYPH|nr:hypothetical protein O9A_00321 [Bartonella koehlerae C-29]